MGRSNLPIFFPLRDRICPPLKRSFRCHLCSQNGRVVDSCQYSSIPNVAVRRLVRTVPRARTACHQNKRMNRKTSLFLCCCIFVVYSSALSAQEGDDKIQHYNLRGLTSDNMTSGSAHSNFRDLVIIEECQDEEGIIDQVICSVQLTVLGVVGLLIPMTYSSARWALIDLRSSWGIHPQTIRRPA